MEESSSEEESDSEQSFVFPEVDDRERFNDATLVSDEEVEGDDDLDTAFVEEKVEGKMVETESEDSGNELPSFACLVEVLRENLEK
jgi:hypothetical protein